VGQPRFDLKLPQPLLDLIKTCETKCIAGCCGLEAYDPSPDPMVPWFRFRLDDDEPWRVFDQFADVRRWLCRRPGEIVSDEYEFNAVWPTWTACADYFSEWRQVAVVAFETARGRPFPVVRPEWRTSVVLDLAAAIDRDAGFDRLPILADALQDAGLEDPDVLGHCRQPWPHDRGCWVVDLVLEKA
jgi:hypothetical protein